jgi:uncharacterized protein
MLCAASRGGVFSCQAIRCCQRRCCALICDAGLLAVHRNSHEVPSLLVPGHVYTLRFALRHSAYRVAAGHRLRVAIASAEFQNAWPIGQTGGEHGALGRSNASHIVLPVAPDDADPFTPIRSTASPHSLPAPETLAQPTYRLELDLVNDTVSCVLQPPDVGRTSSHSHYTVSNRESAHTMISALPTHLAVHLMLGIRIEAACQSSSHPTGYTHLSQVWIT